jgi:hypothetical protein
VSAEHGRMVTTDLMLHGLSAGASTGPHVRSWLRGQETLVDVLAALLLVVVMLADPEPQ